MQKADRDVPLAALSAARLLSSPFVPRCAILVISPRLCCSAKCVPVWVERLLSLTLCRLTQSFVTLVYVVIGVVVYVYCGVRLRLPLKKAL